MKTYVTSVTYNAQICDVKYIFKIDIKIGPLDPILKQPVPSYFFSNIWKTSDKGVLIGFEQTFWRCGEYERGFYWYLIFFFFLNNISMLCRRLTENRAFNQLNRIHQQLKLAT
ncbi:hypothetical protein WA026_016324 [Henosepilachna vigintioctopunctata]|uniref:Uncharacterized protein n=1 Tax=Henosepilachna vigintioctopunctata TaxID=420089 RepID=A0AAW1ULV6_9CUCU